MDDAERLPSPTVRSRRQALAALGLLLAAALAACKEVTPGSGVETIRHGRERNPPGGR